MQYNVAQLLVSTATMAAIVYGEEALISVGTKKLQHVVSDRFLSFTVDPAILLEAARTRSENLQMLAMARTLAPAFLRVAGPDSNYYQFQKVVDPDRSALSADYTVTELQWMVLNEFAQQAGLHLVAALGLMDQENGAWSTRNSLELISLSDRLGYNISWQLGYELQDLQQQGEEEISGSQLGQNVVQLRKMLGVFPRYRTSLVAGPDVTDFAAREDVLFLKEFFGEAGGALSAITWHPKQFRNGYENSEEAELLVDILERDGNALRKLTGRTFSKKPLWIAESEGSDSHGSFKDALVWCQRLGTAAQLGADVLMKKLSVPIMSQPSPEYWVSVLYKSLVGRAVLDTRMVQGNRTHLQVFAHCTADSGTAAPHYEKGAVVVFGVNFMDSDAALTLKAASWGRGSGEEDVHRYVLTLPANNLESGEVLLNGQVLKMNPDGSLPIIMPAIHHTDQSIVVDIPPSSIGFWVIPNAKVRPCMTSANGKRIDFEDLAADHHLQMNWEHPEVNTDYFNSDVGGLRRLRRKHGARPKLSSLNSRRRKNKDKIISSDEAQNDKRRKKISGRTKRYTPLENGPYVIPGLSVELFNPSQHSVKSRIGLSKKKKNIFNQSSMKLPTSRRRWKDFETDDDDDDITINTQVHASLANPEDYYSAEEDHRQFSNLRKRAYGTEFAQHNTFPTTRTHSSKDDRNRDYTYIDDEKLLDYDEEDNFDVDSDLEGKDEVRYFHGPGEFFGNVKPLPPTQNNQRENFGELWEVESFTDGNEEESEGSATYGMTVTTKAHTYIPHDLHKKTPETPPTRYTKNNNIGAYVTNGNRHQVNNQNYIQPRPKNTVQNNDHEFLLYNTGENTMKVKWLPKEEYGKIRSHFDSNDRKGKHVELILKDQVEYGQRRNTDADGDSTNVQVSGLEKQTSTSKKQIRTGENQFPMNADNLSHKKVNKQTDTLNKNNSNKDDDKIPKIVVAVRSNKTVTSSSEESGTYTLKQQSDINKMTAGQSWDNHGRQNQQHKILKADDNTSNITCRQNKTLEMYGENVLYSEKDTVTTDKLDKQPEDDLGMNEDSLEVTREKRRSPRDVPVHYTHMPSSRFLNGLGEQRNYFGNAKPLVLGSERLNKYLDDYNDYDSGSGTSLEELIFTRIHPNQDTVPEILAGGKAEEGVGRPRVELKLRPTLEIEPSYYNHYRVNDFGSKSKFKRDEAKQLQEENSEQHNIHSDRRFSNLDVVDYTDRILQLKEIYSPKVVDVDKTVIKVPGDITKYSYTNTTHNVSRRGHMHPYQPYDKRQSELAEKTSLAENLHYAETSKEKQGNETKTTKDQMERIVINQQGYATQTEGELDNDSTTLLAENITAQEETTRSAQEETTRSTQTKENGIVYPMKITTEEMQRDHPETTEFGEIINKNSIDSTKIQTKNSLYRHNGDKNPELLITNYIISSVTKTPNYEPQNTNNLYTATEHLPKNLDPAYSQTSGNFKLSRKRENMNANTYNLIKLPIPKENIGNKDTSKEKVIDAQTFSTMLPDKKLRIMIPNEDSSDDKSPSGTPQRMTSDGAQPDADDPKSTAKITLGSQGKHSHNAVITNVNDTSKIESTAVGTAEHTVTSTEHHVSSTGGKIITGNSSNVMKETLPAINQKELNRSDTSDEVRTHDGTTHLAQKTKTAESTDAVVTNTYAAHVDKTTITETQSVSEDTSDTVNYSKDTGKETNSGKLHDTSEENSNVAPTGIIHDKTHSQNDKNVKQDANKSEKQTSLHQEIAGFKETSEEQESNAGNENDNKAEERKEDIKSSRFIRMQGDTPGTRFSLPTIPPLRLLPDITKRREERIKALNERRARLRARLLARTETGDTERGNEGNRRKLREALVQSVDANDSSDINQNHFPPDLVVTDHTEAKNLNPSISTEYFIENYLLQQQKQMPSTAEEMTNDRTLLSRNKDHLHIANVEHDKNVQKADSTGSQNPVKSFHRSPNQLYPGYYYQTPIKAYTSFILNNIRGARTLDTGMQRHNIFHPPAAYRIDRGKDINLLPVSHHQEISQNDGAKQRLARETLQQQSNLHHYQYPRSEELYTFSNVEDGDYPYLSVYDYDKLEKPHMPEMTLDYNAHLDDLMVDDLEDDLVHRHGRNAYVVQEHDWPDSDKYDEKWDGNQLLPITTEINDPDIYDEDSIFGPDDSDDSDDISDTSYPSYEAHHDMVSNEHMDDKTWNEFLHMLDETEFEAENEMEQAKLENEGRPPNYMTKMDDVLPSSSDGEHEKNPIPDKVQHPFRLKRSVDLEEMYKIHSKGGSHETKHTDEKQKESMTTQDNLHSQHYTARTSGPLPYQIKHSNIPRLLFNSKKSLKVEDADSDTVYNQIPKTSAEEEWPKYSLNKNREYMNNIKKTINRIKSAVGNHKNAHVERNIVHTSTEMEESKDMLNKETTEEVMRVVFYAYPADESTDTVVTLNNDGSDKLAVTEPDLLPLQSQENQHDDKSNKQHLTEDDNTFQFFDDESKEIRNTATHKHARSQSEDHDISFASILFQAFSTIIKFFKDFKIF